jgi:hypothetical protein
LARTTEWIRIGRMRSALDVAETDEVDAGRRFVSKIEAGGEEAGMGSKREDDVAS